MPIGDNKLPELPDSVNELIADRAIRHALYLERYKTQVVNDLLAQFNKELEPELTAKIQKSLRTITGRSKKLQKLFKVNGDLVKEQYTLMEAKLYEQLRDFSKVESAWIIKTLENVTPVAVDFVAPSANILKALVKNQPLEGALVKDWFGKLSKDTAFNVNRAIQNGMIEGEGIEDIVRRIKGTRAARYTDGILNASRHNIRSIVRTSVSNVAHSAREETYQANKDVVKGVQIIATLDTRTCLECMNLDGKVYEVGEGRRPPFHHSCLPGDSLVTSSSGVVSASKRWFNGKMFVIETASGRKLTCTPNHPVLTDNGWIAANRLNMGGNVVCDGGRQWKSGFVNMNSKNIPAPIKNIFKSSLRSLKMLSVPVPLTSEDFHGDGIDGQVAVISSNRFLGDGGNASIQQHSPQFNFIRTKQALRFISFFAKSAFASFLFSAYTSLARLVSSLCQSGYFRRGCSVHPGLLLFASASQGNAVFFEDSINRLTGTAKFITNTLDTNTAVVKHNDFIFRQFKYCGFNASQINTRLFNNSANNFISDTITARNTSCRLPIMVKIANFIRGQVPFIAPNRNSLPFQNAGYGRRADSILAAYILSGKAGTVFLDNVINIRSFDFVGHVYNLETENNFYSAQGIITHNCRCSNAPILKSWKQIGIDKDELPPATRASMNGQVPETKTYPTWLKKQTTEVQNEALGVKRAQLFRSGQLKLKEFIDRRNKPLTLQELEKLAG